MTSRRPLPARAVTIPALAIAFVLVLIGACNDDGSTEPVTATTAAPAAAEEEAAVETSTTAAPGVTITMAEFQQVTVGKTHDEAVAIIGGPGTRLSETTMAGYTTTMFRWDGEPGTNGLAIITFQNGVVSMTSQVGLG
jgi:hypothetical protein